MKILKCLLLLTLFVACNKKQQRNIESDNKSRQPQNKVAFDSTKINSFFVKFPNLKNAKSDLVSYYQNKGYNYIWFDGTKINDQSAILINKILNIEAEGLPQKSFYNKELSQISKSTTAANPNLETELMLTAQYFDYVKKTWSGLSEQATSDINWHLKRKKLQYGVLLDSIISGHPVLDNPPIFKMYALLKNELKNYKVIKQNGGFPAIDPKIKQLKIGDTSASILNLKKWLLLSTDLANVAPNNSYDDALQTAIKKFQNRCGLNINGKITTAVLQELNVSVDDRISEIALNMERCRWLLITTKADFLVINIPEYKMHVYEDNNLMWSMNAVIGKEKNRTVIFSDKIETLVFSPFWNVPKSILNKEILPNIAKNKNYLAENDMEWYNGNVRQKPGPKNSLGLVKFLFPNSYDIYLHDTPAKTLFSLTNRAFSHGCIRLENAEKLANYLLKDDKNWNAEKIKIAMHAATEKHVKVKKDEAVFIVYFTSWVNADGKLNFRKDIYNRNKTLAALLLSN